MKKKDLFLLVLVFALTWSCKKDDDKLDIEVVPPQSLSETAIEDDAEIKEYLQTHFYNYEEFDNPPTDFDYKIKFDTIAGDNAGKTPIIDMTDNLKTEVITVKSSDFGRDDDEEVSHTLYTLVVREGEVEEHPTIGDYTVLHYEGTLIDGTAFDASVNVEARLYLSSTVRGYGNGVEYLSPGTGPFENGDGTVSFEGYGIGAVFIPSGLGYFDRAPSGSGIASYTPLVFKIDLLSFEANTDFDGDGIPSILEDLDGDGNLNNDNTDQDTERIFLPNHNDSDDDADGIPTIDEIDIDNEGNVTFRDTDGDGISDHLDSDS
ncbi:FKBP-type peptidyl-prolyl cis-trans isomerase [Maribacter sp. HTCC2170]|uniref:FKBP-type peptidyl-prolyl cis-trans isomerase n=1 Tax=Maribacter sp. (strain HTCC2170 / KCCM 42371) TaxID=313603 RepID=UPI00006BB134|nr:FKBP-type peptidyl-prolyl cis-trans isomerase [Maribacter sp. HTCC2170]EAQ99604.1 Peptidylprolyl isomerase, FKBP-type [Maribacter sp. HTCC2170]